jgi:hypothetical protein
MTLAKVASRLADPIDYYCREVLSEAHASRSTIARPLAAREVLRRYRRGALGEQYLDPYTIHGVEEHLRHLMGRKVTIVVGANDQRMNSWLRVGLVYKEVIWCTKPELRQSFRAKHEMAQSVRAQGDAVRELHDLMPDEERTVWDTFTVKDDAP